MSPEQPLYRLELTYTRDEYQKFFDFYKIALKKTPAKLVFYIVISLIIGASISYVLDDWIYVAPFALLGVLMDAYMLWSQKRIDDRVYRQETRSMPVTYRFYADRFDVDTPTGTRYSVRYADLYNVYEVETAFYIMIDKNTVALIPKDECPEGMEDFIRNLGSSRD